MAVTFSATESFLFLSLFRAARRLSPMVEAATSSPEEITGPITFHISDDGQSGYGITGDGTLVAVFSLVPGRGNAIVQDAIRNGAVKLDCFDGYLTTLYARHGFTVARREANWSPDGPDIVYMSLAA